MPDIYGTTRRDEIAKALEAHMTREGIKAPELARHINSHIADYSDAVGEENIRRCRLSEPSIRRFLNRDSKSIKVSDAKVATLESYLIKKGALSAGARPPKVPDVTKLFPALRQFLKIDPIATASLVEEIKGDWAFYAYSEHGRNRVVRGAIKFDVKGGECIADELQTWYLPSGKLIREKQAGYFVIQDNSLIVLLLNKQRPLTKFYILYILSHTDGQTDGPRLKEIMTGALVAVADSKDVFTGIVYMERQNNAHQETEILPKSKVRQDILDILDSREWMSP